MFATSHDLFKYELERSEQMEPLFNEFHRHAFPRMTNAEKVVDLPTQMMGIDRFITVGNTTVKVEEKLDHFADRMNLCFELMQSPSSVGWSMKPQHSDILFYGFYHQKVGYYFNTKRLLAWYQESHEELNKNGYTYRFTNFGAKVQPIPMKTLITYVQPYTTIEL